MTQDRSHAPLIDELIGRYLRRPVRVSWRGELGEALRGHMQDVRLELAGLSTVALPVEALGFSADDLRITPGLPGRMALENLRAEVRVGQRDVDDWMRGLELPIDVVLAPKGIVIRGGVGGVDVGEIEAEIEVRRGWFLIKPRRASLFGVPSPLAPLFRSYLPLPPLASGSRLEHIEHADGSFVATFALGDVDEALTPGLLGRLQRRFLSR